MKYSCYILLSLLISVLGGCHQQQPAEEGEIPVFRAANDTLVANRQISMFLSAKVEGDSSRMLRIIRQAETADMPADSLRQLDVYYLGMAVYYQDLKEWQQALYWIRKARPYVSRLYPWYLQVGEALLGAGEYSELLLYTDSIRIAFPVNKSLNNTLYFDLRGQALLHLGRRQEAFDWYTKATEDIENHCARKGNNSYSLIQLRTIYHAALLHHQQGQTAWAIRHLEQTQPDKYLRRFSFTLEVPGYKQLLVDCYHLLIECYQATGQHQKTIGYLQKIDSIQLHSIRKAKNIGIDYRRELRRNARISSSLTELEKAAVHARKMQNILCIVVCFLLLVIVAGLLAWRHHRRRLRQLYEVLMEQHTLWLQAHVSEEVCPPNMLHLPSGPTPKEPSSQLFLRILYLMDTQKPYRDPAFDLIALSHLAATNRSQLSALINRETPNGFSYWLAEYRVNELIRQTELFPDKSMDELYPLAGFPSRTTFFRQFRQVTGLTPKQYKAQRNLSSTRSSE